LIVQVAFAFSGSILAPTPAFQGVKLPWREQAATRGDEPSAVGIGFREGLVGVQCQSGQQPLHGAVVIAAEFIYVSHAGLQ
jgi:hypothetical protein